MSETNSKVAEIDDDKENHFHRLPEDIIILIFNKIADLMCLCRCSLASKQFAAVIPHVRTVSITIPDCESYDLGCLRRMQKFTDEFRDPSVEIIPSLLDSYSLQHLKLPVFLHKFREIKFINLNYEYTEDNTKSIFPMGKMKLARNSAKIERLVALIPSSVYKDDEDEPDQGEGSNDYNEKVLDYCIVQLYGRHTERLCLILILIKCHSSLRGVTINGPEGKLVIVDEQLDNIYRHVFHILQNSFLLNPIIRYVSLPVLHLPLSGYMLKRLSLWIIDAPGDSNENDKRKLEEITFWDCDDQSAVLDEAIKEILRNHKADFRIIYPDGNDS